MRFIIVRAADERAFRFHSAVRDYRALDGQSFARPEIAERGLSRAAKDVSQAGVVGTAAMLG